MFLPDIRKIEVSNKRVFVRCDLDVTIQCKVQNSKCKVTDENDLRLISGLPTINYLLDHQAKVIIGGHLGRPGGKVVPELSLEPVAGWFTSQFKVQPFGFAQGESSKCKVGEFDGWKITDDLFLLENLRFYTGEEANEPGFAKKLASLADFYVNDAFAMCHRAHASTLGVCQLLPHYAGIHLQEEVNHLSQVLENPQRPLVVIIGGAKIETKLPLVSKMMELADYVLVGGLIAQELDQTSILQGKAKLIVAEASQEKTDISEESINQFLEIIDKAGMIVWNGPVGKICAEVGNKNFLGPQMETVKSDHKRLGLSLDSENFVASPRLNNSEYGTWAIAKGIIDSRAYKIAGGGDTVEYLSRYSLINKFDFVSTGGGAMLSFLSGEKLPGIEALKG